MAMATTVLLRLAPLPSLLSPSSPKLRPLRSLLPHRGHRAAAAGAIRAAGDGLADQTTVYTGVYGPWTVDDTDVREVLLYRSGLVTAAASFLVAASGAFLPEGNPVGDAVRQGADLLYAAGAAGLGLSLVLIHIYVTPIKRFLQALWAVGVVGSVGTYALAAAPLDEGLVRYVLEHPGAMWFVGPTFAALTGLVFKEGLCYGKLEAGILTFVIPILLLGHLSGFMDDGTKLSLLGVWMALFTVFAARKFQQPIKDVIAAASFLVAASGAFLPEGNPVGDAVRQGADLLYAAGAAGLGLSLVLIHIYVTPIKRFLQALWAVGVLGSVGTYALAAAPLDEGLVRYVLQHPGSMWFVGPTFAALTGLVFKEGLCYGKLEAGILTFVIPILLLGHLSGFMDDGTKLSLLGVWMALFTVFAARKFQQPIKDDIGDKSVFMFNALPEEEKKALLQKLEAPTE